MGLGRRILNLVSRKANLAIYAAGGAVGLGLGQWISGSAYNYTREAGVRYDNSIVYTNLAFLSRKQSEVTMELQAKDGAGKWKRNPQDPISPLFRKPNDYYGESVLWAGLFLSWFTQGDAYIYKVRGKNLGQVVQLWYIPHFQIRPMADRDNPDGTKLVTYYEYTPYGGSPVALPIEDVIHIRCGIDPLQPAHGLGPLRALLREICSDNESATYSAAMLRNMGVPGVILSPKPIKDQTQYVTPTPDQRDEMRDLWNSFRRDARGGVLALPMPLDIVAPSFDPQKMLLAELRDDNAARISAAFGIDPMVLGLPSSSKTYSNYQESLKAALENSFLPTIKDIASQIFDSLARDFAIDTDRFRLGFDYSEVRGLQEDIDALHKRWRENFEAGAIDRWTFKTRIGEVPDEVDKGVYGGPFVIIGGQSDKADAEDEKAKQVKAIKARAIERRREYERPKAA